MAGDLDLVKKKKPAIVFFVESIHDISEVFLTYNDRQDINAHQCLIEVVKLYSNHIALHLNALKERLLEEYQKICELEEMPTTRVTRPQATPTLAFPPNAHPTPSEKSGERPRRFFNKRAASAASKDNTTMAVAARPATRELPPQPNACIDNTLYIILKTTLEVIFVSGWGEFILQYQFKS